MLLQVADVLKKLTDKQILIQGHTDNVPIGGVLKEKYPTNWELSVDRATHVVRFLQEKGGVPPEMLVAAGYGPYRPVASNESDDGRSQNRRIEIVLLDKEAVK